MDTDGRPDVLSTIKTKLLQIKVVNKCINYANRIVLCYVILKALWEQRTLGSVLAFDKTLHVARPDAETFTL
jgi:hypothetical protein